MGYSFMQYDEAMKFFENVKNENLKKHMISVAAIMQKLAEKFGEDAEKWRIVGLLHDIDYEFTDMEEHGKVAADMLKNFLPDDALNAIRAHNEKTGYKPEKKLDYALIASDAISGLIVAAALVMPDKKLSKVSVKTLKNKFKDKSFARKISREKILYCEKLGLSLEEFFLLSLNAMKDIANQIGL
ncbi:MAG: HD domain-containing protein [Thermoplasmata archaeon]|nr:MAG: HD domain-containing protein [Thermoplasmata archaeon]